MKKNTNETPAAIIKAEYEAIKIMQDLKIRKISRQGFRQKVLPTLRKLALVGEFETYIPTEYSNIAGHYMLDEEDFLIIEDGRVISWAGSSKASAGKLCKLANAARNLKSETKSILNKIDSLTGVYEFEVFLPKGLKLREFAQVLYASKIGKLIKSYKFDPKSEIVKVKLTW